MMLNYATVTCDQACDAHFRSECEKMAALRARKESVSSEEKKAALKGKQPAKPLSASEPEALSESTQKRPREDDEEGRRCIKE